MVFDYNLDRALWAMLSGNSENRSDLAYLIRTLPEEIYKEISFALVQTRDETFTPIKKDTKIGEIYYHYEIDICNSNLILKVHRWNTYINGNDNIKHIGDEESFALTLNMLYMPLTRNVDREYIGSFIAISSKNIYSNGVYKGIDYKSITGNYDLIGTPFGTMIRCKSNDTTSITKINFDKRMPKEIYRNDFETEDRINNLVKSRKNRR